MNNDSSFEDSFDFDRSPSFSESPRLVPLNQISETSEESSSLELISHEENQLNEPKEINSKSSLEPNEIASLLLEKSKRIYKKPKSFKIFTKSPQSSNTKPSKNRKSWTACEDQTLLHFLKKYDNKWAKIASHIPNRTGKQVRDRYLNVLASHIRKKKPWTEEEDQAIMRMREKIGPYWCKIAEALEGRTEIQVKIDTIHFFQKAKERV